MFNRNFKVKEHIVHRPAPWFIDEPLKRVSYRNTVQMSVKKLKEILIHKDKIRQKQERK